MTPKAVRELREHLQLTQEVFASILGVSFATVNRWENGKTTPTGDYARVLQTLGQLTAYDAPGPAIDWKRVGALSAMAAVAGFSPLLTLGAALAPVLIAHLPSWSDVPGGEGFFGNLRTRPPGKSATGRTRVPPQSFPSASRKVQAKAAASRARALKPGPAGARRTGV
ncbi:MAG TPA: helix-turn-helix domain-containing protein [Candidatus Binatia bacterium]|nr:helix-turn-helix domain-containing protein [Candidatus Binatia bacterium]